ncbi:MAG: class D sortase [Oscillospiraceae bacterium]|nr:class D sortase [Oscillospiraceae bacterium]
MKRLYMTALALSLCLMCAVPASALEYSIAAPDDYLFGKPTSVDVVYTENAPSNADRSKNVALVPPQFGSPTSYLPGTGEYLTPNLVPGALSGGLVTQFGEVNYPTVNTAGITVDAGGAATRTMPYAAAAAYTEVTSDLYYSGGYLATLKIPTIGVNVKVYQGTDSTALAKGAGHFEETSIWDGRVAIAGHNRGANCYFGQLHTLAIGDRITLTTKLGTRTYAVIGVEKVSETDRSGLAVSSENLLTLYTCVRDQSSYRWCVTAKQV